MTFIFRTCFQAGTIRTKPRRSSPGNNNRRSCMDYEPRNVEAVVAAAPAVIKLHAGREIPEVGDMQDALDARKREPSAFNDRYVVEVADMLTGRLDDKSLSAGPEWEKLSKSVDVAMGRNQPETEPSKQINGAQMAARGAAMGQGTGL